MQYVKEEDRLLKLLLFVAILAASPLQFLGQTQSEIESTVRQALNSPSYTGTTVKQLEILGDESSVVLTKIISGKEIQISEIPQILLVIRLSYSDPRLVDNQADREPRTMLLLRFLDLLTTDATIKRKINDCQVYVQNQYAFATRK
jgi:hypothetical protein